MNNQDKYKKYVDQIKASEDLKEKTIQKMKMNKRKGKIVYLKYLSACAVFALVFVMGNSYYNKVNVPPIGPGAETPPWANENQQPVKMTNNDLPRFKDTNELMSVLKENTNLQTNFIYDSAMTVKEDARVDIAQAESVSKGSDEDYKDFSKTNVQVENVDEADIVKTDGDYIYYITREIIYIIKADSLEIVSKLNYRSEKENFIPYELYVNGDKLIVLGDYRTFDEEINETEDTTRSFSNRYYSKFMSEALILDISDKENPEKYREIKLDGEYKSSRMIGDNVYLISSKNVWYYNGVKEDDVLPIIKDTASGERKIEATDIAYFKGTDSYAIMTVAGFDINNKDSISTETFFGASDTVYASENNLYLTQIEYTDGWLEADNTIYKFKLNDSKIELLCKGKVRGNLRNQFSMDEYEGNLRIATTLGYDDEARNQLYVLDENLEQIGKIENMAVGEKIYSVRFIGKIGYVVTFKQIDPLFVIDLSDPRNPEIKGELKIPGYSSYLHPYDETHIIGIGYNTKSNGFGGVTNANMKMSMFDVSDLEHPKEMFNVDIGNNYAYSDIMDNHKVLFEHKGKDLIGFPVTLREYLASQDKDAFMIYHIDLEKGFEKYGEIEQNHNRNYMNRIKRAIYIDSTLYTLAEGEIRSYTLDELDELNNVQFDDYEYRNYYDEDVIYKMETVESEDYQSEIIEIEQ